MTLTLGSLRMLVSFFGNLLLLCLLVVKSSLSWINTFEHPFALKSFSDTVDVDFGSIDTLCFPASQAVPCLFPGLQHRRANYPAT